LLPNLTITLRDERNSSVREDEFHFANGLSDYITYLNQPFSTLHSPFTAKLECSIQSNNRDTYRARVEVSFQYTDKVDSNIIGYVNTLRTVSGYHTDYLPEALLNIINQRVSEPFSIAEIMPGLTTIVSVWHPFPHFESWANIKLINRETRRIVAVATEATIPSYTDENVKQLIQKLLTNRQALQKG
jgi:DNA gyrase/topoisomerase IV subunit B